jgi:hypothetical protein
MGICSVAALVVSCNDDDKKDSSALCDKLMADGIQMYCSGYMTSTISNIQYSRIISLHYHFTCSSSGEDLEGDITNMQYNSNGEILPYDATINGVHCHYPN